MNNFVCSDTGRDRITELDLWNQVTDTTDRLDHQSRGFELTAQPVHEYVHGTGSYSVFAAHLSGKLAFANDTTLVEHQRF